MKKFKLFDFYKAGKGITKAQAQMASETDVVAFIKSYINKFWNLSTLNLMFVFSNFPAFFAILALSGNFRLTTTAPLSPLYAQLFGILQFSETPFTSMLSSIIGGNGSLGVMSATDNTLLWLSLLVVFTCGVSNVGTTYVLRNYVRGEPVFMFSDYFYAIKKNWKQALPMGIFDCVFTYALVYGLAIYAFNLGTYALNVMFFAELILFILYLTMRFYIYNLLITFDLSIYKIIKNSFILSIVGFKRNLAAWVGIVLTVIFSFYVFYALPMLGIVLPVLITISTVMFMCEFAAFPNIKKYVIDPYYADNPDKKKISASQSEPIFRDRG